jgi:hypothetical protein
MIVFSSERGTAHVPPGRQPRWRNPVSPYDTLPGIDRRNASLAIKAIAHATGHMCLKMETG